MFVDEFSDVHFVVVRLRGLPSRASLLPSEVGQHVYGLDFVKVHALRNADSAVPILLCRVLKRGPGTRRGQTTHNVGLHHVARSLDFLPRGHRTTLVKRQVLLQRRSHLVEVETVSEKCGCVRSSQLAGRNIG